MKSLTSESFSGGASSVINLAAGESVSLPDAVGYRVNCVDGIVWITCSERKGMVQLHAGESLLIQCRGCAALHAQVGAQLTIFQDAPVRVGLGRLPSSQIRVDSGVAA